MEKKMDETGIEMLPASQEFIERAVTRHEEAQQDNYLPLKWYHPGTNEPYKSSELAEALKGVPCEITHTKEVK